MAPRIIYDLPRERIALHPASPRDSSRLMAVELPSLKVTHTRFSSIPDYFSSGDVIVVNNSRVIGARLRGRKSTGGEVEFLLLERSGDLWKAMGRPASRLRPGMSIRVVKGENEARVEILEKEPGGTFTLRAPEGILELGVTPLPPYIASQRETLERDKSDYQSFFARHDGSVAAPTSTLHFTPPLAGRLSEKGVRFAPVTLHIGPGTFRPSEKPAPEKYRVSPQSSRMINSARRLCAAGTTVMRTLETASSPEGRVSPSSGIADVYIKSPYRFRSACSMFITNFHMPGTPLLELVAAFIEKYLPGRGAGALMELYSEALSRKYRFLSYGDSMLLLGG